MPKITYIEHDGTVHTVEAEIGSTVMETALRNDVASIVAECGGSCTCATSYGQKIKTARKSSSYLIRAWSRRASSATFF
jgi:ferredoxin